MFSGSGFKPAAGTFWNLDQAANPPTTYPTFNFSEFDLITFPTTPPVYGFSGVNVSK